MRQSLECSARTSDTADDLERSSLSLALARKVINSRRSSSISSVKPKEAPGCRQTSTSRVTADNLEEKLRDPRRQISI
jgi:hypothetical protein